MHRSYRIFGKFLLQNPSDTGDASLLSMYRSYHCRSYRSITVYKLIYGVIPEQRRLALLSQWQITNVYFWVLV